MFNLVGGFMDKKNEFDSFVANKFRNYIQDNFIGKINTLD